jgi:uncharacterized membrane protein
MANMETGTEKALESQIGLHFDLPPIRRVPATQPLTWLVQGCHDLKGNLLESLLYGAIVAAVGLAIWNYAAGRPQPFTASITGFFLLAPLLAAGLYEISRRHETGRDTGFGESLQGWKRSGGALAEYGLELVIVAIFWERLSAILFALLYQGAVPNLEAFYRDVFLSGAYWQLAVVYVAVGGVLAIAVFVLSAISIPMLLDRNVDVYTAMATSLVAVGRNIPAMAVRAILIVLLTAIGFATYMIAMIPIFPVLGHATWHAYRDLTKSG